MAPMFLNIEILELQYIDEILITFFVLLCRTHVGWAVAGPFQIKDEELS
jgi:hypothetical protein